MIYWARWGLRRLGGRTAALPKHWPLASLQEHAWTLRSGPEAVQLGAIY